MNVGIMMCVLSLVIKARNLNSRNVIMEPWCCQGTIVVVDAFVVDKNIKVKSGTEMCRFLNITLYQYNT